MTQYASKIAGRGELAFQQAHGIATTHHLRYLFVFNGAEPETEWPSGVGSCSMLTGAPVQHC
jgi:hypothetical protein